MTRERRKTSLTMARPRAAAAAAAARRSVPRGPRPKKKKKTKAELYHDEMRKLMSFLHNGRVYAPSPMVRGQPRAPRGCDAVAARWRTASVAYAPSLLHPLWPPRPLQSLACAPQRPLPLWLPAGESGRRCRCGCPRTRAAACAAATISSRVSSPAAADAAVARIQNDRRCHGQPQADLNVNLDASREADNVEAE